MVLPGASGTHNVCVCTIHQNVKLMLERKSEPFMASKNSFMLMVTLHYKHLLANISCNPAPPGCHLRVCQLCGGMELTTSCYSSQYIEEANSNECPFCGKVDGFSGGI